MSDSDNSARAQFITLGALVLLILMIGGVQVAYSGINSYDDRQSGVSQQRTIQEPVEELAGGLTITMTNINHAPTISDSNRTTEMTEAFLAHAQSRAPRDKSTFTEVDNIDYVDGTRIAQTDSTANFTADSAQADWEVFSGATDTRQFMLGLHDVTDMPTKSQPHPEFNLTTTSTTRSIELYVPTSGNNIGNIVIEVDDTVRCAVPPDLDQGVTTVDLLRGNIDGTPCPDFGISDPVTAVRFKNGDTVTGTFSITYWGDPSIRNTGAVPTEQDSSPAYAESNPVAHDVVYAAVVDITAVKSGSSSTQTAIIAPGDIHTQLR